MQCSAVQCSAMHRIGPDRYTCPPSSCSVAFAKPLTFPRNLFRVQPCTIGLLHHYNSVDPIVVDPLVCVTVGIGGSPPVNGSHPFAGTTDISEDLAQT